MTELRALGVTLPVRKQCGQEAARSTPSSPAGPVQSSSLRQNAGPRCPEVQRDGCHECALHSSQAMAGLNKFA